MKTLRVLALAFIGVQDVAVAQDREPDALYLTGQADAGASLSGGGGESEWLHWVSPRTSMTLGGAAASLGDLWWAYGSFGGFSRRGQVMWSGRVSLGSGRHGADTFGYARYVGSATVPIARNLYAEAEGQHARMVKTGTTVFKIGGLYSGAGGVSLRLAYYTALSAGAHVQSISGRADGTLGRVGMFGGVTTTTRAAGPIHLPAIELLTHVSREFFVGASVQIPRAQLIAAAQIVPRPAGTFSRVIATMRLPLGSRRTRSSEVSP